VVQVKKSEALSASNPSLCQIIINDANVFFFLLQLISHEGVEIKANNLQYVMDLLVHGMEEGKKKLLEISKRF